MRLTTFIAGVDNRRRLTLLRENGATKGVARIRSLRRALTDDEQDTIAKEIVERLQLFQLEDGARRCGNLRFSQGGYG